MEILRTPEECFANLKEYPFTPHYVDVGEVSIHFVDEGPAAAPHFIQEDKPEELAAAIVGFLKRTS